MRNPHMGLQEKKKVTFIPCYMQLLDPVVGQSIIKDLRQYDTVTIDILCRIIEQYISIFEQRKNTIVQFVIHQTDPAFNVQGMYPEISYKTFHSQNIGFVYQYMLGAILKSGSFVTFTMTDKFTSGMTVEFNSWYTTNFVVIHLKSLIDNELSYIKSEIPINF